MVWAIIYHNTVHLVGQGPATCLAALYDITRCYTLCYD